MRHTAILRSFARPPWPLLFVLAGFGLVVFACSAGRAMLPVICGADTARTILASGWPGALELAIALNPPARLFADWALMLLSMMPPLLAVPLMHVWQSSLPRRRLRALVWFVLGYGCIWMAAGPVLTGLALMLQLVAGEGLAAFTAALLLAMVWSASPWQRAALNRGHRLGRIGLFGWMADCECLSFGVVHALWCIASCWPWMLVPLVAGRWHLPIMVLAAAVMLRERLAAPDRPHWRLPGFISLPRRRLVFARRQTVVPHA
jgi:predicted metal-binding membrane protein